VAEQRRQSGGRAAEQRSQRGRGEATAAARAALGGRGGRTAAAERGKRRQHSKTEGRQDSGSGRVSEWGMIEGVNGDVWVPRRWLGADGGGRGGRRSKAVGEGLIFFRMGHVLGLRAPRSGGEVFSQSFFLLSNLTAENTQDHSVLTEHKNLRVCRLRLITISVGM
jgi:hypothetical protein